MTVGKGFGLFLPFFLGSTNHTVSYFLPTNFSGNHTVRRHVGEDDKESEEEERRRTRQREEVKEEDDEGESDEVREMIVRHTTWLGM